MTLDQVIRKVEGTDPPLTEVVDAMERRIAELEEKLGERPPDGGKTPT
jgi:hypothetical protein